MEGKDLPRKYRPLSPWQYFGLTLLYQVPIVGFVFLIIFSISKVNINRRNFSRSFFCVIVVEIIVIAVLFAFGLFNGIMESFGV